VALLPDRYVRVTRPTAAAGSSSSNQRTPVGCLRATLDALRPRVYRVNCLHRDRHGLCADIAGALAAHGIEILSAELNTRETALPWMFFHVARSVHAQCLSICSVIAIERSLA